MYYCEYSLYFITDPPGDPAWKSGVSVDEIYHLLETPYFRPPPIGEIKGVIDFSLTRHDPICCPSAIAEEAKKKGLFRYPEMHVWVPDEYLNRFLLPQIRLKWNAYWIEWKLDDIAVARAWARAGFPLEWKELS